MLTLYFNRCFSAYAFLIESLKDSWEGDQLKVIISHSNPDPYLMRVADHFEIEPHLDNEMYLDFILQTCKKYQVDVFFPRKHVTSLSQYRNEFAALGVHCAFVCSTEHYQLFDHKFNATQHLLEQNLVNAPHTALVESYNQFETHYHRIRSNRLDNSKGHETVCLKPNVGIGGKGFMRISHHRSEQDDLFRESLHSIAYSRLKRTLREMLPFPSLLLSTYLQDEELSVDCIGHQGDLLAAYPRFYVNKYEQRYEYLPELIETCRQITSRYQLNYLYNVQFKKHRGQWYFIELNTRSAAGAHRICPMQVCPLSITLKMILKKPITDNLSIKWDQLIQRQELYTVMSDK